jgi:hypothetical protein
MIMEIFLVQFSIEFIIDMDFIILLMKLKLMLDMLRSAILYHITTNILQIIPNKLLQSMILLIMKVIMKKDIHKDICLVHSEGKQLILMLLPSIRHMIGIQMVQE